MTPHGTATDPQYIGPSKLTPPPIQKVDRSKAKRIKKEQGK